MKQLGNLGLTSVFVEGGGELAAALLRANLIDEIHWIPSSGLDRERRPSRIGAAFSYERLRDAVSLEDVSVRRRGDDVHITASIRNGKRR